MIAAALLLALVQPMEERQPVPPPPPPTPACDLPPVDRRSALIVVGFYEGNAVSTVSVAGLEEETTVGELEIAPGRQPLTLVLLNFDPMIFRITGASPRVRQVILISRADAPSGVVGVPANRVAFASAEDCDLPYRIYQGPPGLFAPRIRALFGRGADYQGGRTGLYRGRVDAAGVDFTVLSPVPDPSLAPLTRDVQRSYPAGIAEIAAEHVVSRRPAERYRVLPATAGIMQLVREGALAVATRADLDAWLVAAANTGRYRTTALARIPERVSGKMFRVVRPIEVPGHLCGAHSVTLIAPDRSWLRGGGCHSTYLFLDGSTNLGSLE